jgi:transcriptional regulator GlxA family with amidase domain
MKEGGPMQRRRVGILIFPEVEVLDFAGPFEVLSVCRLNEERRREEPSPFEVLLVAHTREPVRATGGLHILPDHDLANCPPLDVLIVPGGWGTRALVEDERLIDWIAEREPRAEVTASVCTGAFLLGKAGLLDCRRATTHWKSLERMRQAFPAVHVQDHLRVVDEGRVITSAGISAGIDMALRLVARFHGETVARATARHMEYPYPET